MTNKLIMPTRRGFLAGLGMLLAAPAIVRASSIMPVKALPSAAELEVIMTAGNMRPFAYSFQLEYLMPDGTRRFEAVEVNHDFLCPGDSMSIAKVPAGAKLIGTRTTIGDPMGSLEVKVA